MGEGISIYDYNVVLDDDSGWRFPYPKLPLTVRLSNEYSIGGRSGMKMLDWLLEHKVPVNPLNVDTYTYNLPDLNTKLEFILTWS
jgi:hypothetical protein